MLYVLVLGSVLCTVFGQLFYKRYSINKEWIWLVIGIGLFNLAVPCSMIAARGLGIGPVYVGSSLSYVLAPVVGWWFFAEPVKVAQWKYFALIMLGVMIYAW